MAEVLKELQAAKVHPSSLFLCPLTPLAIHQEEAAFATKKLADVILEVHRSQTAPPKSPPTKTKRSPGRHPHRSLPFPSLL
jgi:hypothetical protein